MIEQASFQTRARTVDHLGREQVADCPTAISELWKNAFDAYATKVGLDIYDGLTPAAVVWDNGHGMDKRDFSERWLVIGTESKVFEEAVPHADRRGLQTRVKQGQKGIGRLSCANLGPILLLISKRKNKQFIASMIDWRLFENPYLNLSDVAIPVVEFDTLNEIFRSLPDISGALGSNIKLSTMAETGLAEGAPKDRIELAWHEYDLHAQRQGLPKSSAILTEIKNCSFDRQQLESWESSLSDHESGTVLLVSGINYDLITQLAAPPYPQSAARTRKNFHETLSSFIDPYVDLDNPNLPDFFNNFSYEVKTWKNGIGKVLLSREKGISRKQVSQLEHCITGTVYEDGTFTGQVKAWGKWLPDYIKIFPAPDIQMPDRVDTKLGQFDLYIAAMEFDYEKSSHEKADYDRFKDLAGNFAGFMIFRDGLRVLPYGRSDNDFFEIEERRSKHAGREYWNHRQMFGRISLSRYGNPNIRDKAGREGVLDNRAAKALKDIVTGILMQSARKYFGTDASIRKDVVPEIIATKKEEKAAEARRRLQEKNRQSFSKNLKKNSENLPSVLDDLASADSMEPIRNDFDVIRRLEMIAQIRDNLPPAVIDSAPRAMSPRQKETYSRYREQAASARTLYSVISKRFSDEIEAYRPTDPLTVLNQQFGQLRNRVSSRVNSWQRTIRDLQTAEYKRVSELADSRKGSFKDEAESIVHRFKLDQETFVSASARLTAIYQLISSENEEIFEPYVRALEGLQESIDFEHLAMLGMEELAEARVELDRLNSLAQLGIAVEITGHDLQDFDDIIASGLARLPSSISDSTAVRDIRLGYEGLTDQLRFLSPLRLSGTKIERWIQGTEIYDYISKFFAPTLTRNSIDFRASERFMKIRVFDQPSRILPVYINLINNSIYWLSTSEIKNRAIELDADQSTVFVSDNGPGVYVEDIPNLFRLFFTKKIHGGRGVGLYLAKANLASGGHKIRYAMTSVERKMSGANFVIELNGAEYSND